MQRKAYVPAAVALLAALLAACTGGSGDGSAQDDKAGSSATSTPVAQPGKYSTLSDACTAPDQDQLEALLPGLKQLTDEEQREKAYDGTATLTYDNDRRSGCRWKAESDSASDQLYIDFERVVSYDSSVSDDDSAARVFGEKEDAADIPEGAPPPPSPRPVRRPPRTRRTRRTPRRQRARRAPRVRTPPRPPAPPPTPPPRPPSSRARSTVWATKRSSTTR